MTCTHANMRGVCHISGMMWSGPTHRRSSHVCVRRSGEDHRVPPNTPNKQRRAPIRQRAWVVRRETRPPPCATEPCHRRADEGEGPRHSTMFPEFPWARASAGCVKVCAVSECWASCLMLAIFHPCAKLTPRGRGERSAQDTRGILRRRALSLARAPPHCGPSDSHLSLLRSQHPRPLLRAAPSRARAPPLSHRARDRT